MPGTMPRPVQPGSVENALRNTLERHGITDAIATSIWHDLTTGNDPMPIGLPAKLRFHGIELTWPAGRGLRILQADERRTINRALIASSPEHFKSNPDDLLNDESNAFEGRAAYGVLWNRTQQPGYTDPTTIASRLDALVAEATVPVEPLDNVLCGHRKPKGRVLCIQDNHHGGLHSNGKQSWDDAGVAMIQHRKPRNKVIAPQPEPTPEPMSQLDALAEALAALTAALA